MPSRRAWKPAASNVLRRSAGILPRRSKLTLKKSQRSLLSREGSPARNVRRNCPMASGPFTTMSPSSSPSCPIKTPASGSSSVGTRIRKGASAGTFVQLRRRWSSRLASTRFFASRSGRAIWWRLQRSPRCPGDCAHRTHRYRRPAIRHAPRSESPYAVPVSPLHHPPPRHRPMHDTAPIIDESKLATEQAEAFAELTALAHRKSGKIPPELLARHVLATYGAAEWPVQRAAMEALLRRLGFAKRDRLRVAERPEGGPFGLYRTRRPRTEARPYRTYLAELAELGPVSGSCDCPDFRRGSLGLCKHLLVVLDDLASRPRVFQKALDTRRPPSPGARLTWDPIRPLFGAGDWMERIVLYPGTKGGAARSAAERELARRFVRRVGEGLVLRNTFTDDPKRRLELAAALAGRVRLQQRRAGAEAPALLARLAEERERLERADVLRRAAPRLTRALRSLERPLYDYQKEGVERFLASGRLLLADDMGLGKTAQAIAACHALFRTGLIQRGLVIVPAPLKHQWYREWGSFSKTPIEVVDGSPAERAAMYRRARKGLLIANYEQVLRDLELMQQWKPDLVILDEAQRIKNWAAKTSHGVKELRPPYRLVLTGTPMENRLEELASIFDWVDDHALEPKWRLVPFHAEYVDGTRALAGARHLDVLRERIEPCTVRRLRRDILKQLPPRTDTEIPVPLTIEQQDQHDELRRPISALVSMSSRRPLTQSEFLRLMQLLNTQRIIANGLAQLDFTSV
ncbi:MAG: hypothetical protein E2O39_15285, partial [Planctomycetota bacterium]